jgi:hypothetical protein
MSGTNRKITYRRSIRVREMKKIKPETEEPGKHEFRAVLKNVHHPQLASE